MKRILFIHGPGDELGSMVESLRSINVQVLDVESNKDVGTLIREEQPELVIVASDLDTQQVICSQIRTLSDVPLITVGGRDDEVHRMALLDLGADICLSDPVSTAELIARIKSMLRRYESIHSGNPTPIDEENEITFAQESSPLGAFFLHTPFDMKVGAGS